jgi:hypothetical protein
VSADQSTERRADAGGRRADDQFALGLVIDRLQGLERRLEATVDRVLARFDRSIDKLEQRFDTALVRFESRIDELEDLFDTKIADLEGFHLQDQAATKERVAVKTEQLSRWQKWAAAGAVLAVGIAVANFAITMAHIR